MSVVYVDFRTPAANRNLGHAGIPTTRISLCHRQQAHGRVWSSPRTREAAPLDMRPPVPSPVWRKSEHRSGSPLQGHPGGRRGEPPISGDSLRTRRARACGRIPTYYSRSCCNRPTRRPPLSGTARCTGDSCVALGANWAPVVGRIDPARISLQLALPGFRSTLAPSLVRCSDLLRQRPVAVEGGVLVDRHRGLRGVAGARLQLGGRGAVLTGEG